MKSFPNERSVPNRFYSSGLSAVGQNESKIKACRIRHLDHIGCKFVAGKSTENSPQMKSATLKLIREKEMMKLIAKPPVEVSRAAVAEINRALYDAADKAIKKQFESDLSLKLAPSALNELQEVISRARDLGGEEFAKTVEEALNKYIEQISAVQAEHLSSIKYGV